MGFWDNLYDAADRLNSAMEKKQEEISKKVRAKIRPMSDSQLRNAYANVEPGSLAERIIEEEMARRGMY